MSKLVNETEATQFHVQAGDWLQSLGFDLISDTQQLHTRFGVSHATYKSERGLHLRVSFNPTDGNSASLSFGRYWLSDEGWAELSNQYFVIAKSIGIELPSFYRIGYADEVKACVAGIWGDLQRSLPKMIESVSLERLKSAENERFGARQYAIERLGPQYESRVQISPSGNE